MNAEYARLSRKKEITEAEYERWQRLHKAHVAAMPFQEAWRLMSLAWRNRKNEPDWWRLAVEMLLKLEQTVDPGSKTSRRIVP